MKLQETKPAQRCAYCHSDGERLEICPNCQTSIHLSCLQETRSCPTIGCDAPVRRSIKLAAKTISWAQYSVYSPQDRLPHTINGEKIVFEDSRRVEIVLPFGLLAEFVGFRVVRDRRNAVELDEDRPRHILGLADQGVDPSQD